MDDSKATLNIEVKEISDFEDDKISKISLKDRGDMEKYPTKKANKNKKRNKFNVYDSDSQNVNPQVEFEDDFEDTLRKFYSFVIIIKQAVIEFIIMIIQAGYERSCFDIHTSKCVFST